MQDDLVVSEPKEQYGLDGGWVKLWRKSIDSPVFKSPNKWLVWCYCLMSATHKPYKTMFGGKDIELQPGQFITGIDKMSEITGLTGQNIRTALTYLKSTSRITSKVTNYGRIITICNWDTYQSGENQTNKQTNKQTNRPLTDDQQTANRPLTAIQELKELKEHKEHKEERPFSVLAYLESLNDGIEYNLPNINDYDYNELLISDFNEDKMHDYAIAQIWIVYRQHFPLGMKFKSCYHHIQLLFEDNKMTVHQAIDEIKKMQKITGKKGLKIWEVLPVKPMTDAEKWQAGKEERDARWVKIFADMKHNREKEGLE